MKFYLKRYLHVMVMAMVSISISISNGAHAEILGGTYSYVGDFKITSQEGNGCAEFFVPSHQIARMSFLGTNSRTIVVNMTADNGQQGPLLGLNLSGLYGTGDFRVERISTDGGRKLSIVMDGFVEPSFIAFALTVQRFDSKGNRICSAKGDFYGSPGL